MSEKKDKGLPPTANNLIILAGREPPPRLKVIFIDAVVLFPYSSWPIIISSSEIATAIHRDMFALLVHRFHGEDQNAEIGTLAIFEQMEKHAEQQSFRITFRCLSRAKIIRLTKLQLPDGQIVAEADWFPVPTQILKQEPKDNRPIKENVELLSASLNKLCSELEEAFEGTKGELGDSDDAKHTIQTTRRNLDELGAYAATIQKADAQNIEFALDRTLDALEHALIDIKSPLPRVFVDYLREILWAVPLENRLELAANFVALTYGHLWELFGAEETTEEQNETLTIQEFLSKPREVPVALPPINKEPPVGEWIKMDLTKHGPIIQAGMEFARRKIVNQEQALEQCFKALTLVQTGLSDPQMPEILGMFCGPTGVGKTEIFKVLANFLFGDPNGFILIEGNTLTEPHSTARLTGAPPGYIGYSEKNEISQWRLDRPYVLKTIRDRYREDPEGLEKILEEVNLLESQMNQPWREAIRGRESPEAAKQKLMSLTGWQPGECPSILCLDEIEKAHINVQYALLGVLNEGIIRKADGDVVVVKNMLFGCTSNIYGREIAQKIAGKKRMGILPRMEETTEEYKKLAEEIYHDTLDTLEKGFVILPELLGRIGKEKVRVFYPFSAEDIRKIIETLRLPELAMTLKAQRNIDLYVSEAAIIFLRTEIFDTTNRSLGARAVKSVIQRKITENIANQLSIGEHGGLVSGDSVLVDVEDKGNTNGKRIVIKKLT